MRFNVLSVGLIALAVGSGTIFLPLLLPRTDLNKYIVVAGMVVGCWGLSCVLLGMSDLLRRRRG